MKLIFMGTPDFAVEALQGIVKAGHEVPLVVTQPDKPKGRGKTLTPTPVKAAALDLGLQVYQPEDVNNPDFMGLLEELKPDAAVVVAFGQMLSKEILEFPAYGCLNVHASLLPKYRGAAPIQWAVIRGEEKSGVTVMRMDEGLDTGDVLAEEGILLNPDETGGSLFGRLSTLGAQLLVRTLRGLAEGDVEACPQPRQSPTPYASMIKKGMGCMDWGRGAVENERLCRGLFPWPGTFTYWKGKNLKIQKTRVAGRQEAKRPPGAAPGQVLRADEGGIYVNCGDGCLCIQELQLEGRKKMPAADFLRGCHLEVGAILG